MIHGRDDARDRATAGTARTASALPDLDSFLERVFSQAATLPTGLDGDRSLLRRDYETAFNLLRRASEAFPAMLERCERLEEELNDIRAEAEADVAAAHGVTEQWHALALALKEKVEDGERDNAVLRQRLAEAEAEIAAGRRLIDEKEQQARVAAGITTLFHDKIVEAFGVGSKAHSTLDLVARGDPGRDGTRGA